LRRSMSKVLVVRAMIERVVMPISTL
jgi:hypothetical protein